MATLVTGGNRGIGLEVCRQLSAGGEAVLLGSRDLARAERAAAGLAGEAAAEVRAVQLDVTDAASIAALARDCPPLEALIHNAAVALDGFDAQVVRRTLAANLHAPIQLTDALLPRLRADGRLVMVSSSMGELSCLSDGLAARLRDPALTRAGLLVLAAEFQDAVADGSHRRAGWPSSAYSVSKALLNGFVRVLAHELAVRGSGVRVNAVCPGWVRTDMGGRHAPRSVEEGARGIVWAASLPPTGPSGGFFRDGAPIDW